MTESSLPKASSGAEVPSFKSPKQEEVPVLNDQVSAKNENRTTEISPRTMLIVALVMLTFSFGYIAAVTFLPVPAEGQRIADTSVGFLLGTVVATILNYLYGSSMGSKSKEQILNKVVGKS